MCLSQVLYLSNNRIKEFDELDKLSGIPVEDLLLIGTPLHDGFEDAMELGSEYRVSVLKRVPTLKKVCLCVSVSLRLCVSLRV